MKTIIRFLMVLIFGICSNYIAYSQNVTDSSNNYVTQEEFESILSLLKIDIFKFKVDFPMDQKCIVGLYKEEYEKRKLIKENNIWATASPFGSVDDSGNRIEKPLQFNKN
jgi:hypothetical protein